MLPIPKRLNPQAMADRITATLYHHGATEKHITIFALVLITATIWCIGQGYFLAGLALILINRLLDMIDAQLGQLLHPSDITDNHGANLSTFADIMNDYLFYGAVPFAFALFDPRHNGAPSAFLLLTFMASAVSFLTIAALAAKRNIQVPTTGPRSFIPVAGLPRGIDVLIFFILICLFASFYDVLAYGFGGLCWLAIWGRVAQAKRFLD